MRAPGERGQGELPTGSPGTGLGGAPARGRAGLGLTPQRRDVPRLAGEGADSEHGLELSTVHRGWRMSGVAEQSGQA